MKKILPIVVVAVMLAQGCHRTPEPPSREQLVATIDSIETPLMAAARMESVDTAKGNLLVSLYAQYAERFPGDSLAAPYLHRAAQVSAGMGRIDDMVVYYNILIDNYPDYQLLDFCYFEKGIALDNAGRKDAAREAYNAFLEEYPDHFLAEEVKRLIPLLDMSDQLLIEYYSKQNSQ